MVLDRKRPQLRRLQPLHRLVVQVDLRDRGISPLNALRINRVSMVLRRDLDSTGRQVAHRMVAAAVPELQLERLAAERIGQHLIPQADPEDRRLPQQAAHRLHRVPQMLRVPRAGRKQHPVRLLLQHLLRRRPARHHDRPAPELVEVAQDAGPHPVVHRHDPQPILVIDRRLRFARLLSRLPLIGRRRAHLLHQVRLAVLRAPLDPLHHCLRRLLRRDRPHHHPRGPQLSRQRPRIDPGNAGDFVTLEEPIQRLLRPEIARHPTHLFYDQPRGLERR